MGQYIPQVLICLVRVNRKKLGIVSIAAVCPNQLLELFFALCPVDGIYHAGGQKLHGVIPVSYTHLDVYKRQRQVCELMVLV